MHRYLKTDSAHLPETAQSLRLANLQGAAQKKAQVPLPDAVQNPKSPGHTADPAKPCAFGSYPLHHLTVANPAVDRKSTRLNSSHLAISYAVFCLTKSYK